MADKETSSSKNIPRLNGANYSMWKAMIKGYFMTIDCWGVVNGTQTMPAAAGAAQEAWLTKDSRGMGTILLYCDPVIAVSIESKNSAHEMWTALETSYRTQ